MISACVVTLNGMDDYLKVFLHSISTKCKYVREVIIVKIDERSNRLIASWKENHIDVHLHGCRLFREHTPFTSAFAQMICGHALGMHRAIDLSQEKYVWMCDPDIFFLMDVDRFYLDLIEKYGLNIIGASHFNAVEQSYLSFPCAINCMVEKASLPGPGWLTGELYVQSGMRLSDHCSLLHRVERKYLIPGPLKNHCHRFPNPDGIFDMGCNLWLWNHQKQGKWIGFNLNAYQDSFKDNAGVVDIVYPLNYSTAHYDSNFSLQDDFGSCDLLFHRTRGSKGGGPAFLSLYTSLYRESAGSMQQKRIPYTKQKWWMSLLNP